MSTHYRTVFVEENNEHTSFDHMHKLAFAYMAMRSVQRVAAKSNQHFLNFVVVRLVKIQAGAAQSRYSCAVFDAFDPILIYDYQIIVILED